MLYHLTTEEIITLSLMLPHLLETFYPWLQYLIYKIKDKRNNIFQRRHISASNQRHSNVPTVALFCIDTFL